MQNLFKHLFISIAVVSLVGCAATVTQTKPTSSTSSTSSSSSAVASASAAPKSTTAPRAQASAGALVAVVTGSAAAQSNSDWSSFLQEWESSLTDSAVTAKTSLVFAKDETAIPANASVLIRLTVNDFKYVSTTKRFMLGILAGNAFMDVDAQYVELPANKIFDSKKFNTSSSAWEGIFSAVTPKQVRTVSELIVKDVVSTSTAQAK